MEFEENLFWIWLSLAFGPANGEFRTVLGACGSPYDIFSLTEDEIEHIDGISERSKSALLNKNLDRAYQIAKSCRQADIGILPFQSTRYPQALRELKNPPSLLYYRGKIPGLDRMPIVAMVGTRKMSEYGMRTAYRMAYELSSVGLAVVSGMAAGIDGVSAVATLKAGGFPIAILGCGLDRAYPAQHEPLMRAIADRGLLLSEYPPMTRPVAYHFPVRNRLISGLSQGVVVVEAGLGSGSLITAKEAVLQGKEVFAVPYGRDENGAVGAESLLREGARFATRSMDVLNSYLYLYADRVHPEQLADAEEKSEVNRTALAKYGVLAVGESTPNRQSAKPVETKKTVQPVQPKRQPQQTTQQTQQTTQQTQQTTQQTQPQQIQRTAEDVELPEGLSELGRRMVRKMLKIGGAMSLDLLVDVDMTYGQVLSELTILELQGVVAKQAGGLYKVTL